MPTIFKIRLPVLAVLLVFASACSPSVPRATPTFPPIPVTDTPAPSASPTASLTTTPIFPPTPSPTASSTPLPGWVTGFAQPILAAIADRSPSFQDDFGAGSAGWQADGWCGARMKYVQGELVVTDCRIRRPGINHTDFAVEFDGRFLPEAPAGSKWLFHFRDIDSCSHSLDVHRNGNVELSFKTAAAEDSSMVFSYPKAANGGDRANHFLVIGKGSQFAVFLNGEPLSYAESGYCKYGDFRFFADETVFALDNFRVWNIENISTLPTQLPAQTSSPSSTAAFSPTPELILPTNATYRDWPLYLHSIYRFLFAVPPGWTASQVGTNFIQLNAPAPSQARFTIGVRWADEDVQIQRTGVPEGDLVQAGTVPFWGDVISKSVLVYEGRDKAVLYNNGTEVRAWDKVFTLGLGDSGLDYAVVDLTGFIATADAIVGSIAPPE